MEKKTYLVIMVIGIYNNCPEPGRPEFLTSRYYTREIEITRDSDMDIHAELVKFQEEAYATLTDRVSNWEKIPVKNFDTYFRLAIIQLTVTAL